MAEIAADPDARLGVAIANVLLCVAPRNLRTGTSQTVQIYRDDIKKLQAAFEDRWPGMLEKLQALEKEPSNG